MSVVHLLENRVRQVYNICTVIYTLGMFAVWDCATVVVVFPVSSLKKAREYDSGMSA